MKKMSPKFLLIAIALTLSSSLVACSDSSSSGGEKDGSTYGRTVTGLLGYYYSGGYVLPLNGSGLQAGCELPASATYETEPLLDTGFDCRP